MKLPFFWALALITLTQTTAHAEYRVFVLQITSADGNVKTFESTLDPDQYRGYYPLRPDDKIFYTDTWMCKGRTVGYDKHCENPRAPASATDKGPEPQAPPSN